MFAPQIVQVSPVTKKQTIYNLYKYLDLAEGNSVYDTVYAIDLMNSEFYLQGIDAFCAEINQISSEIATWVETHVYIAEPPQQAGQIATVDPFTIAQIIGIIKWVIVASVIIGGTIIAVKYALHTFKMEEAYPKLYYVENPETGEGDFYPRETAVTLKEAWYPGMWIDPTTTLMLDPSDPDFEERKKFVILNTPEGWGEPQTYPFDFANIINTLIIGAVVIGGIVIAVKFLPSFLKRRESES